MKIPDFTMEALEQIGKTFFTDTAKRLVFAVVWTTIGVVIGINI